MSWYFKTSYVIVYQYQVHGVQYRHCYFKTSYVIVYLEVLRRMQPVLKFQNILCYCLSSFAGILTCRPYNFKTSYVIVYRIRHSCSDFSHSLFQNILCYCLSQQFDFAICYQLEFQNILCYCLSACKALKWRGWADFKTSYVIVYLKGGVNMNIEFRFQNILCYCLSHKEKVIHLQRKNFKTSYVIVYHIKTA